MDQRRRKKPTVISLFCGVGGSSLGYHSAGDRELAAVDWDPLALAVFRRNVPGVPAVQGDLFEMTPREVMKRAGIRKGELDVLDGSPPCQGFSMAGKRRSQDRRSSLVFRYAEMVREIRPRVAIMENVAGLAAGRMRLVLQQLVEEIEAAGYVVGWRLLNAADYGVAQDRRRVILLAVRKDTGKAPSFPEPLPTRVTVEEALKKVRRPNGIPIEGLPINQEYKRILREIPEGGTATEVLQYDYGYKSYFGERRIARGKPSFTLTASVRFGQGGFTVHPTEDRLLSVAELKALCGFPPDFELAGTYEEQVRGLGNAVMPPFMEAVAREVRRSML